MLKTLFKRKEASKQQEEKVEPDFPSLDERPLFEKPGLNAFTFEVDGMLLHNERGQPIQPALLEHLQTFIDQNAEALKGNTAIEALTFSSAQVIFFRDKENIEDPHATKVYLDFTFNQLHIGYVPSAFTKQLIDIINEKKARSFEGTFHKVSNTSNEQPAYIFQIKIMHI